MLTVSLNSLYVGWRYNLTARDTKALQKVFKLDALACQPTSDPLILENAIHQSTNQMFATIRGPRWRKIATYHRCSTQKLFSSECLATMCPPVTKYMELIDTRYSAET